MSKQRPNSDKLANELAGASAFFRSTPPPTPEPTPAPAVPVAPDPAPIPEDQPERDVTTSRRQNVTPSTDRVIPRAVPSFDINRPTASRDSLRLSPDETRALDDLRQALKWDFDLAVSKNDICRAALHWILEDFDSKGEKSQAVTRLKRKLTSR